MKVSATEKKFQPSSKKKKISTLHCIKKILQLLKSSPTPHHFSNGPSLN